MTRRLASVRDYDQLHRAIRARVDELGATRAELDDATGLQNGYAAKLLAPIPIKGLGRQSLGPMLQALGLGLDVIVLEEHPRINKSSNGNPNQARWHSAAVLSAANLPETRAIVRKIIKRRLKRLARKAGRIGGTNSRKYMSKRQARRLARKAGKAGAKARWNRPKLIEVKAEP